MKMLFLSCGTPRDSYWLKWKSIVTLYKVRTCSCSYKVASKTSCLIFHWRVGGELVGDICPSSPLCIYIMILHVLQQYEQGRNIRQLRNMKTFRPSNLTLWRDRLTYWHSRPRPAGSRVAFATKNSPVRSLANFFQTFP